MSIPRLSCPYFLPSIHPNPPQAPVPVPIASAQQPTEKKKYPQPARACAFFQPLIRQDPIVRSEIKLTVPTTPTSCTGNACRCPANAPQCPPMPPNAPLNACRPQAAIDHDRLLLARLSRRVTKSVLTQVPRYLSTHPGRHPLKRKHSGSVKAFFQPVELTIKVPLCIIFVLYVHTYYTVLLYCRSRSATLHW